MARESSYGTIHPNAPLIFDVLKAHFLFRVFLFLRPVLGFIIFVAANSSLRRTNNAKKSIGFLK